PAIAGESSEEAEPSHPPTVPETITEPDLLHDQAFTPPRPTTTTASGLENGQGPSSDPNPASSSRPPAFEPDQFTSTYVEDDTMGGSFDISPPRTTQAPPKGTTSGGAEDPDKLTALSSLVDSLVQKVDTQASDLKAHKLMFKEVVGKLVKKVKVLEDKIKGRKRKFVMTDSDKEDPLIKLAKAAATAVPTGGSHEDDIPHSSSFPSDAFASGSDVPAGATTGPSTVYPSSTTVPTTHSVPAAAPIPAGSGTTPESPSSPERDARKVIGQREEDRLGEEAGRRMYEEEKAELEREREELQRKRQQDVLNSAKYYTDTDWNDIIGQVHANQGLTADLLGPDVTEDNFAERMVALIAKRRREFAAQRPGVDLEQASLKKSKSTKAPKPDVPADSQQPSHTNCFLNPKVSTRRKAIRSKKAVHTFSSTNSIEDGDPEAEHKMCIKYVSDADSASDDDTPINLHGVVDWELLPTGLGWVNVIYRKDNSRKCFSRLREILHLVTRTDLMVIYGRVMTFYQDRKATRVGLVLLGDLKVLIDSPEGNDGSDTVSGLMLHMFVDKRYPLSVNLIERMLDHQLEIFRNTVGNELTTVVQLIAFLKKQISDSRRPKVHDFCGDPVAVHLSMLSFLLLLQCSEVCFWRWFQDVAVQSSVPAGSVVPTGKDSSIVSTGSTNVDPMGDALSRKERVKSRRVRGMILAAQSEAFKQENVLAERLHGLEQQMERKGDESLYFMDRIWVLLVGSVMVEAHASRLRWTIYPVLLADAAESVRDAIGFEYCLASSSGWTKVKEKPKAVRDCQKSYVDFRRKPLEFELGDRVLLKVTPWKGVVRFRKKGKLAPRYVGPFEILKRIGPVAYRLRLSEELSGVHDTFHVSNLKKCLADASLHVPLDEIKVDKTLRFVEEPVEIMDREIKSLKRSKISLVKVRWNSKRGPEFTRELYRIKCTLSCLLIVLMNRLIKSQDEIS
ncbi:hypothetical protein Tco_0957694, partial [Tanacetum coccineum]